MEGKSINNTKTEETLEKEVEEDGWLEVGKRNRMVVTRTVRLLFPSIF